MSFSFCMPVAKPTEDVTHIEVTCQYQKAGMSYATYQQVEGGFYLTVKPITVRDGMVGFMLFSGRSVFVEPASRASKKKEQQYRDIANRQCIERSGPLWEFVKGFLEESKLELATAESVEQAAAEAPVFAPAS